MSADRTVEIGSSSTVDITGAASMISSGSSTNSDAILNISSSITADSLSMTGGDEAKLNGSSEVTTTNNFNMDAASAGDCFVSGSATITAGSQSGNCL